MDELLEQVGLEVEKNYVKGTYDAIAEEFSGTRYKKWPKVEAFLERLPKGSLVLDVGCGNGKYLDNRSTINIGCDISEGLLSICKDKGFHVVHCDMTRIPFKEGLFDAVICIAALHHVVGVERRKDCLKRMFELLSYNDHSKLLVQVWSYEQELEKNNPYLKLKHQKDAAQNEVREVQVVDSIRLPVHKNRTSFTNQDVLVPFHIKSKCNEQSSSKTNISREETSQHLRYYHVFKEKELDNLVEQIPNAKIVESYYDKGNWCSIITRNLT